MKDYSAMSDFEINREVALNLGAKDLGDGIFVGEYRRYDIGERVKNKFKFDPCKSWGDAGPIIQENKINIDYRESVKAGPMASQSGHKEVYAVDKNPLRAAMIVFLMMKDAEK